MFRMDQFGVFKMLLSLAEPPKGMKSSLAISNGPKKCVLVCVSTCFCGMWCDVEPLLLGSPTVWDLTAPTAVSMTG